MSSASAGRVRAPLLIDNTTARRLWIERQGLATPPAASRSTAAAASVVDALGMVQLDPIRTVARAHEHILWSRCSGCRPAVFERLVKARHVFEHFSHDAVILPMALWPYWQRQREHRARAYERGAWGQSLPPESVRTDILRRIEREGPLCSRDFDTDGGRTGAWSKPAHKLALDWLWLGGTLAVSHRRGFVKHYDLVERVIPEEFRLESRDDAVQIDHLCRTALERLGVASAGELQRFWDATTAAETRDWITSHRHELVDVLVEAVDGRWVSALAAPNIEARIAALPEPGPRLRIVNPFDPLVRDRTRLTRLFGFDYRIEIYVPPSKRRYGYYVFPLLEGTRFVGRAEIRTERAEDRLAVRGLWLEPGVRLGKGRRARLLAELERFARLAGVAAIDDSWQALGPQA